MERCPSGLRCMIGNHVAGEYRHGGSNPPLSATKSEPVKQDGLFYFVKNGIFKDVKSCFCPHFAPTLFLHEKSRGKFPALKVLNYLF